MTTYARTCQQCQQTIYHKSKSGLWYARKHNSLCKACYLQSETNMNYLHQAQLMTQRPTPDGINSDNGLWYRVCPQCNERVYHKNKQSAIWSHFNGCLCKACSYKEQSGKKRAPYRTMKNPYNLTLGAVNEVSLDANPFHTETFEVKQVDCPKCGYSRIRKVPINWNWVVHCWNCMEIIPS
jgi:hypothetical protein